MGRRGDADSREVHRFSTVLFNKAGYNYTDPAYHGPPGDRTSAVDHGYLSALQGLTLPDASKRGEDFVKNLMIFSGPPAQ
jgi:hypothetical protein